MAEISTDGLGDWWDRASQAERDSFERDVYDALNTALRLWGPKASSILLRQVRWARFPGLTWDDIADIVRQPTPRDE